MKTHIYPAIKITIILLLLLSVVYPVLVWAIAQIAPNHGKGEMLEYNGQKYYRNIGQAFTRDDYFSSRPSAVGYNAAGSGGSNKGPSNGEYLSEVRARIDTFLVHNPTVKREQVPVDIVTASGSGLDPDISIEAAKIQIDRVAKARGISVNSLQSLVDAHVQTPLWNMFGPRKINVLELNIALDKMAEK
ncbi:Potassium-transporting ATPase C chain [compost metagenome]|uniref:Potassium-transporting ATPase KdpC subunit n=1 Tax=Sphingobacterium paramultivorum TaxID=2886510 RepID=A0A7G5DYN6_9SPHI|nr:MULTISPECIES: K(+)-transporting ATPase subunit C [Sphingobacterium]MCS4163211.1 K+-transporting ATPase ATPase C chain [Sphingobacterium sp. BIGb0116]QMV66861.1 K(+)-transporting ATPase subunit C [Sphingobacterium paramultivorum]WSO15693.1 K(+)-transporting ATPase subunit C [Sphingobacterium paramultivorum]